MPVIGDGGAVWSLCHVEDAAAATVAALERGAKGLFNVVDDEPTWLGEFLPGLAEVLRAKPPPARPVWLAKPLIGDAGVWLMTKTPASRTRRRGPSSRWAPRYPSWRDGFRTARRSEARSA